MLNGGGGEERRAGRQVHGGFLDLHPASCKSTGPHVVSVLPCWSRTLQRIKQELSWGESAHLFSASLCSITECILDFIGAQEEEGVEEEGWRRRLLGAYRQN